MSERKHVRLRTGPSAAFAVSPPINIAPRTARVTGLPKRPRVSGTSARDSRFVFFFRSVRYALSMPAVGEEG